MSTRIAIACLCLSVTLAVLAGCMSPLEPGPSNVSRKPSGADEKPVSGVKTDKAEVTEKGPLATIAADSPLDARFEEKLLEIGKQYRTFAQIGDLPQWAPTMCIAPRPKLVLSASSDDDTHGHKLYYLFAKDKDAFLKATPDSSGVIQPLGQAIVKDSYRAVEVAVDDPHAYAHRGGKGFKVGERHALFVMLKLDPATEGTDEGWVYATLTPDGKKVTAAGVIKACVGCHQDSASDRMFGYKASAKPTPDSE